jgi:hypothetical protein
MCRVSTRYAVGPAAAAAWDLPHARSWVLRGKNDAKGNVSGPVGVHGFVGMALRRRPSCALRQADGGSVTEDVTLPQGRRQSRPGPLSSGAPWAEASAPGKWGPVGPGRRVPRWTVTVCSDTTVTRVTVLVGSKTGAVTVGTGSRCYRRLSPSAGASSPFLRPVPSLRHIARRMQLSCTPRSCTLGHKGCETRSICDSR